MFLVIPDFILHATVTSIVIFMFYASTVCSFVATFCKSMRLLNIQKKKLI